ncbi:hypothetical protein JOD69_002006 [Methylocaldum sp. RMAD-M]|jgi:hypothetical protein|nr:hypothetical protein [Methylocaldum sp. RMAD-M]
MHNVSVQRTPRCLLLTVWIGANPVQQNELVLKTDIREFSFETSQ